MKNLDKMIEIKCDCDKVIDFHELTEFQGGLKERTQADYDKAKKSILKYGWSFVLYYWNDGKTKWIIDGHNRVTVLKQLEKDGYFIPPIPAIEVFCKDRKEAKEKLLRLNSTFGKLTKESVLEFAEDIDLNFDEIALPDTVIDFTDQSGEIAETEETSGDNDIPEVKKQAISKLGEMYELGNSILLCGSSTNAEDVNRLCAGIQAELLFTSPPYSDMRTYNGEKDLSVDNIVNFIRTYRDYAKYMCVNLGLQRKEGAIYPYWNEYTDTAKDVGLKMLAWNVWNKTMAGSIGMQQAMFPIEHEWIFIYGEKAKDINRTAEKRVKESIGKTKTSTKRNADGSTRKSIKHFDNSEYKKMESVFECLPELSAIRSEHPAVFPVKLPEEYIKAMTKENDYVIEPFGGSGTTLIACEKTNRKCRIMELDPIYCDVIRRRYTKWAKENGKPITSGCLE